MGQTHSGHHSRSNKLNIRKLERDSAQLQGPSHRKKRQNRIGTIRKKLAKTLKVNKHVDYRKQMREILQTWTTTEITRLVEHYESLRAWKDVLVVSSAARPPNHGLYKDLINLYEKEFLSDIILVYKNTYYPVHLIILSTRCPYFSGMFSSMTAEMLKNPIDVTNQVGDMTLDEFSSLLKVLYTGDESLTSQIDSTVLKNVTKVFTIPNIIESDLKSLMLDEASMDLDLQFSSITCKTGGEQGMEPRKELILSCHSCLLAARSPYFKSLLTKLKTSTSNSGKKLCLIVDEAILPRQYAVVVIKCLYQSCIDLQSVIKWRSSEESFGAMFETDKLLTTSEVAMELYEIACFLEFTSLMEGCEDIIYEDLSHFSLVSTLEWSSKSFGSLWVKRQTIHFIIDNFVSIAKSSSLLASISKDILIEVLQSDHVQASEEDILNAIIKWGEWQAARVLDKRGSTLLSSSLTRRSPKRRDVSNASLYAAVEDFLPLVRVSHILPSHSLILQHAYQRKLFEKPLPLDVCASYSASACRERSAWMKHKGRRDFVSPRFFIPYFNEAKLVLSERFVTDMDSLSLVKEIKINTVPDMLAEVTLNQRQDMASVDKPSNSQLPSSVLDKTVIQEILTKEEELLYSAVYKRALHLCPDKPLAFELRRHVVRLLGLPDDFAHEFLSSVPDLVEDSDGSTSSKQSTLSKIGFILAEAATAAAAPDVTLSALDQFQDC